MINLLNEVMGYFEANIQRNEAKQKRYNYNEIDNELKDIMIESGFCPKCWASPDEIADGECSRCLEEV